MRRLELLTIVLLCLAASSSAAQDEAPVRTEQLIYSLMSYNGRDYSPSFCRQTEPTIYLIAKADNFASVRSTLVYLWPTTGEWYTDSRTLNVSYEGVLELTDRRGRVKRVEPAPYTYFSVQERYTQSWQVSLGAEAEAEWARSSLELDAYQAAMSRYNMAKALWEEGYAELANRIAALREGGKSVESELAELGSMRAPEEPRPSSAYLVPPVPVRTGYVLRLEPGAYAARLLTPEGLVVEGSDKTIVAFERRGSDVIGYDLIPSDRWTRSAESNTPASVIYSSGGVELYLRPFYQDEYNDLYYRKAIRNDAVGNPTLTKWVKVRQVERAEVEVSRADGSSLRFTEAPFLVVQTEGTALGYAIVPFDSARAEEGEEPTLRALAVALPKSAGSLRLRLYDAEGKPLPSGERQIRIVRMPPWPQATMAAALIPLVAGLVVFLRRRRDVER